MAAKKTGLGRGLEALLSQPAVSTPKTTDKPSPTAATAAESAHSPVSGEELARIPLDLLQRGRYQPRLDMRPESLQELADSIRAQGVVQPIVVRPVSTDGPRSSHRYEIIAGERRWRAAQIAGLQDIPAVIRQVADKAAVAMALIENIQREDLNPLEEARALERLIQEFEMTHQQAAEAVGRSRVAVSNLLRLLDLVDDVKTLLEERRLEMGHARALLALPAGRQQAEVARLVATKGLTVRETEALVRRMNDHAAGGQTAQGQGEAQPDPNIRRLQDDLTDKLGAKVAIQHGNRGRGKLVIAYNSLDELDGILSHIQ